MLYHKDIRLPKNWRLPNCQIDLEWTRHATAAATSDRYGVIERYPVLDLSISETIEVELEGCKVRKLVLRTPYDAERDVIHVLIPNGREPWTVKTVWFNLKTDTHSTLDRSRYVQ
jgi:hypothetical protein